MSSKSTQPTEVYNTLAVTIFPALLAGHFTRHAGADIDASVAKFAELTKKALYQRFGYKVAITVNTSRSTGGGEGAIRINTHGDEEAERDIYEIAVHVLASVFANQWGIWEVRQDNSVNQ